MKKIFSLPDNTDFFNRYAGVIRGIILFGVFCQLVSFFTESGIVYTFLLDKLNDLFPALANILSIAAALIISLAIELGLRSTLPKVIQAVLYKRWSGLDGKMNVGFTFGAIILLVMSTMFSFNGSKLTVENIVDDYQEEGTEKADSTYNAALALVLDNFSRDSMQIASSSQRQINAANKQFKKKVDAVNSEIRGWSEKEDLRGKNYTSQKRKLANQKAAIEVEQTDTIAAIENRLAVDMATLLAKRNEDMTASKEEKVNAASVIENENKKGVAKVESIEKAYGTGLAWITIVCQALYLLTVYFNEVFKKGSGITETIEVDNAFFESNPVSEFLYEINRRVNVILKRKIRRWAARTPDAPLPARLEPLYQIEKGERVKIISAEEVLKYWAEIHAESELKRKLKSDKKAAKKKEKLTAEESEEFHKLLDDISKGTSDQKNGSAYEGKMPPGKRSKKLTIEQAVNNLLLSSEYEDLVVLGDLDLDGIFRYDGPSFFHVGPKAKNGVWKGLLACSNSRSKYSGLLSATRRKLNKLGDTGNGSKQATLKRTLSNQSKSFNYWASVCAILEGIKKGKISREDVDSINEQFRLKLIEKTLKTA